MIILFPFPDYQMYSNSGYHFILFYLEFEIETAMTGERVKGFISFHFIARLKVKIGQRTKNVIEKCEYANSPMAYLNQFNTTWKDLSRDGELT